MIPFINKKIPAAAAIILSAALIKTLLPALNTPAENQKPAVFWTLQLSSFDRYINDVISKFGAEEIKWIDVPYSEGSKRMLAAVLSDNPPDLANLTPDFSMLLAQKKVLEEIPAELLKNYNLKEQLEYNGKYYGIPFYASSPVTFFNKKLMPDLKKKNLTYDDILKLKPPDGVYTIMLPLSENDTLLKILNKYGINSPDKINSKESKELFKLIKSAFDNRTIPKESASGTHRDALEKYMAAQTVFLSAGANFLNMIKENAPEVYENTVILPQLTGSSGLYDFSLMNLTIPVRAGNKEKALEFALLLTDAENQLKFAKLVPILPVNKEAFKDDFFKNADKDNLQAQAGIISAEQLNSIQPPLKNIKRKNDLNALGARAIQEILLNNKDIQETLDNFKTEWQKLLEE